MIRRNALLLFCLLVSTGVQAATTAQIDDARAKGLAWLIQNQQGSGAWHVNDALDVQSSALALSALRNAGMTRVEAYRAGMAWLGNAEAGSTDALSRQISELAQAGAATSAKVATLQAWQSHQGGGWGAFKQHYPSPYDTALATEAVMLAGQTSAAADLALMLTNRQHADGGWGYGEEATSRLIPTTQAVLTLARYRSLVPTVDTDLTEGVNWLLTKQKTDYGFADDGSASGAYDPAKPGRAYESALVYQALRIAAEAGNSAAANATTLRNNALHFLVAGSGQPQNNGSWGGDPLATGMVLAAMTATTLADSDADGLPDAVEAHLSSNTAMADGRGFATGNGQVQAGVHTPLLLPPATVGVHYSYNLAQAGLSAYDWASGSLPPGLNIDAAGQLSGTPTQSGVYSFGYSASPSFSQLAQLTVGEGVSDGDVPLPGWALLLLGGGLVGGLLRRSRADRT